MGGCHVLKAAVFDDEYIVLHGLQSMIDWSKYGIELIGTASNGQAALDLFMTHRPDIVFTDIRMPIMDGLQVVEEILSEAPETMCIVFSGFNEFEYVKRTIKLGVVDYLEKPITIPMMEEAIQKTINRINQERFISSLKSKWEESQLEILEKESLEDHYERKHVAVENACRYMETYFDKDLSLQKVADHVGMNSTYFSLLFKEEMGKSYIKYLTGLRMERAKNLLREGVKVTDVSKIVGYYSYRHFSDLFKKNVGVTPGQYK